MVFDGFDWRLIWEAWMQYSRELWQMNFCHSPPLPISHCQKQLCFLILSYGRHWGLDTCPLQLLQPHHLFKPGLSHVNVSFKFKVSCPLYWAPRLPHGDREWRCISTSAGGPQSHLFTLFTPPSFSLPLLSNHRSLAYAWFHCSTSTQMCIFYSKTKPDQMTIN